MINKTLLTAFVVLALVTTPRTSKAVGFATGPLVDHPVHHPLEGRTGSAWRSRVGTWGENFVGETYRLRGFNEIHEIKNGSNNGIDRIAVKRGPSGQLLDIKFVEVKTTRSASPRLSRTRYGGTQMSRKWLAANLKDMRTSGDPALKKLALEISRFRKASGVPIQSLGEITHLNTRTGRLTGYTADGSAVKYSESIERLLKKIQARGGSKQIRAWAIRTLSEWDQIRSSTMSRWLGKSVSQQSSESLLSNSGRVLPATGAALLRESRSTVAAKVLRRAAGPIAAVVAFAMDAKELYDTEYAYRTGLISVRQRNIQLLSSLGGMGGAFVGAAAGGFTGAWLGAFGGPFAWITVPAGGTIGAIFGGVGGYFGGSAVAGYGATVWYKSIDASVKQKFETLWLSSTGALRE